MHSKTFPVVYVCDLLLLLRSYFIDNQVLIRIHEQVFISPAGKFLTQFLDIRFTSYKNMLLRGYPIQLVIDHFSVAIKRDAKLHISPDLVYRNRPIRWCNLVQDASRSEERRVG